MPQTKSKTNGDHNRTHKRVLVNFLPHELRMIDDHLSAINPGRENRSEFLRDAALARVQAEKKNRKPA